MIRVAEPQLLGRETAYVADCLRHGQLSAGAYVQLFERSLADACGAPHVAVCCNGTAALHLALLALDVQPGDEVIVPALTYVATANAVKYCGGVPVFADVDPRTWMLTPETIVPCITPRTKGMIVVHLYGCVADVNDLDALACSRGWWLVEDAAEAIGAVYHGRPVGGHGHVTTLSFYGNKVITCGEGGAVLSPNASLDTAIRLFRGQGVRTAGSYAHEVVGYNYRLGELQAAVGVAQLERLSRHLTNRGHVWHTYRTWAAKLGLQCQHVDADTVPSGWMFTFLVPDGTDRDDLARRLERAGIQTRPAFPLVTSLPMYRRSPYPSGEGFFPVAENVARRGLTLPTHGGLTDKQLNFVCQQVEAALIKKAVAV